MATPSPPFVPRDVFRLLVKLEAQKTHDVDTETLAQRFRVPPEFAKDESLEQRERKAQTTTPGPGAYEARECWTRSNPSEVPARGSAAFVSRLPRDPFQLEPLARQAVSRHGKTNRLASSASASSVLDVPPPLGSFTRTDRGIVSTQMPPTESRGEPPPPLRSTISAGGTSFERAPRATHVPLVPACALGPAQYDVKRLWDAGTPVAPTPAVFSMSTEKRAVVWSPARSLPTNAVTDTWDASPYYAKHKRHVERERRRVKSPTDVSSHKQQPTPSDPVTAALKTLAASASSPTIRTRRGKDRSHENATRSQLDPFDWLRRQPHGEQRANALAAKHGLAELVRPLTAAADHPLESEQELVHDESAVNVVHHEQQHRETDEELNGDSSRITFRVASSTGAPRDERITVSCRLQGGLVVSVKMYSAKRIRHLKAALVRRQTRFQNEDQFDLFLSNGKPLAQPEETLEQAGVRDRALVQVVAR